MEKEQQQKETTSTTQQWANPTPAGLVALAVACFGFFALLTGRVDKGAMPLLGCFLLGGFVIQIIVALLDLKSKNLVGGNTFLYFSAFFMLASGIEMFIKANSGGYLPDEITLDGRIDGWVWLALALVVLLWTPAFFKSPAILFMIVLVLNVAVICIAFSDLKVFSADVSTVLSHIAGWALLTCGVMGIYLSAAIVVNGTFGKTILPNPKPFYKGKNKN